MCGFSRSEFHFIFCQFQFPWWGDWRIYNSSRKSTNHVQIFWYWNWKFLFWCSTSFFSRSRILMWTEKFANFSDLSKCLSLFAVAFGIGDVLVSSFRSSLMFPSTFFGPFKICIKLRPIAGQVGQERKKNWGDPKRMMEISLLDTMDQKKKLERKCWKSFENLRMHEMMAAILKLSWAFHYIVLHFVVGVSVEVSCTEKHENFRIPRDWWGIIKYAIYLRSRFFLLKFVRLELIYSRLLMLNVEKRKKVWENPIRIKNIFVNYPLEFTINKLSQ